MKGLKWSGFIMGLIVGTGIYYAFEYMGFAILVFFFVTGTLLSKIREKKKKLDFDIEKGGERDLWQVLANGGVPLLGSIIYIMGYRICGLLIFAGSISTVTGDTWATETGIMWGGPPFLITTGKRVKPGVSGGITWYGLLFSLIGSTFVAFLIFLFYERNYIILIATMIGGIFGGLWDSFMGALLQRQGYCPECKKFTEKKIHDCGTHTEKVSGINWINNDVVNFISAMVGGGVTLITYLILLQQ